MQLIADLSSFKTRRGGFFLISSTWEDGCDTSMVEDYSLKVDLYLSDPQVKSRKKFTQHINNATKHFFDYDDKGHISIILINKKHPGLKLTHEAPFIELGENCSIFQHIKESMIDMTIISHLPTNQVVHKMYDELFSRWNILQQQSSTVGFLSINRCSISEGKGLSFDQTANHQIGFLTPSADNECSGNVKLSVEDFHMINIFERIMVVPQLQKLPAQESAMSKIPICCDGSCLEISVGGRLAYREGQIVSQVCCYGRCHGTCVFHGELYLLNIYLNHNSGDMAELGSNHCKTQRSTVVTKKSLQEYMEDLKSNSIGPVSNDDSRELFQGREVFPCNAGPWYNHVNPYTANDTLSMQQSLNAKKMSCIKTLTETTMEHFPANISSTCVESERLKRANNEDADGNGPVRIKPAAEQKLLQDFNSQGGRYQIMPGGFWKCLICRNKDGGHWTFKVNGKKDVSRHHSSKKHQKAFLLKTTNTAFMENPDSNINIGQELGKIHL